MKMIQENEYLDTMKNEVEPYLKVHCREGYIPGADSNGSADYPVQYGYTHHQCMVLQI